eukprot:13703072-Alexandrium_andersonii.AAC.1
MCLSGMTLDAHNTHSVSPSRGEGTLNLLPRVPVLAEAEGKSPNVPLVANQPIGIAGNRAIVQRNTDWALNEEG